MLDYWIFISIPVIFALFYAENSKINPLSWFIVALVYIVFIGLRDAVGPDWIAYIYKYEFLKHTSYIESLSFTEPGFASLNWIIAKIDGGIYVVNVIIAFILVSGVMRLAILMPYPWLALISVTPYLVIVIGMSAARQATAIGIVFHLIASWIHNTSVIKKILYTFVAIIFHYSAFISLIFVLQSIKVSFYTRLVILGTGLLVSYPILTATNKYSSYEETYLIKNIESSGALMHVSLNAIPALIYFLFFNKFKKIFIHNDLVFLFSVFSILSVFGVFLSSTAVDRLSLYLTPIQMMIYASLPLLFESGKAKMNINLWIIFIHLIIMFIWFNFASHSHGYIPYQNVLFF